MRASAPSSVCRPDPSQTGRTSRRPPLFSNFFCSAIFQAALRVPLRSLNGIYAPKRMLRLRLAFAKRTYYTMMPRSDLNKTAFTAVLHGVVQSPSQKAHRRTKVRAKAGLGGVTPRRLKPRLPRFCMVQFSSPCAKTEGREAGRSMAPRSVSNKTGAVFAQNAQKPAAGWVLYHENREEKRARSAVK